MLQKAMRINGSDRLAIVLSMKGWTLKIRDYIQEPQNKVILYDLSYFIKDAKGW
jgi:hypothetical protein